MRWGQSRIARVFSEEIDAIVMKVPEVRHLARHPRQVRGGGEGQQQNTNDERFGHHISSIARTAAGQYEVNQLTR
jgi:hypothetical protein